MDRVAIIVSTMRQDLWRWWTITLGTVVLYYLALLASLMIRFGALPNYINTYNWWQNVILILDSTPSIQDSLFIIRDEWLLEIGYMNYDFGIGISEWSLFIVPIKVLAIAALGALLATNYLLLKQHQSCTSQSKAIACSSGAATGAGALLISLASISLSWVVCCSTPTWVVGLAMLGLGASTALWLEPMGQWLNTLGFITLIAVNYLLAGQLKSDTRINSRFDSQHLENAQ